MLDDKSKQLRLGTAFCVKNNTKDTEIFWLIWRGNEESKPKQDKVREKDLTHTKREFKMENK